MVESSQKAIYKTVIEYNACGYLYLFYISLKLFVLLLAINETCNTNHAEHVADVVTKANHRQPSADQ